MHIPVEKDQLWLTGPMAAKLMGWCWGCLRITLGLIRSNAAFRQTFQEGNLGNFTGTFKELCPRGGSE